MNQIIFTTAIAWHRDRQEYKHQKLFESDVGSYWCFGNYSAESSDLRWLIEKSNLKQV